MPQSLPAAGFFPVSLLEDVLDSLQHGEPLCCMARPGGGGEALVEDLAVRMAGQGRVVRASLDACCNCLDAVTVLAQGLGKALGKDLARPQLAAGLWREPLADLLAAATSAQGQTLLLLEGLSAFLLRWQGGLADGQDSARRMDLRILFDMLARAASPRLAVVLLATPGLTTLLKCHRVEDVLAPFNELTLNLPGAEAHSDPAQAAQWLQAQAASRGLTLSPDVAEQAVDLVGGNAPEHLALLLGHAVRVAALGNETAIAEALLQDVVAARLLGPFEHARWRKQEDALFAAVEPAFLPLVLEILRRAGAEGITVEEAFKLAGVGSPFIQVGGSMPVHLLRQHLEWMEQEGFLERQADRYVTPGSLFGRWLAAVHAAPVTHAEAAQAGGDSAS